MKQNIRTPLRRRFRMTALALPLLAVAALGVRAEKVASGTDFVSCMDDAWANYNKCLMTSTFAWERKLCDIAFQADVVWCGARYYHQLQTAS